MKRAARFVVSLFVPRGKFAISFLIFLIIFPLFLPFIAVGQGAPQLPSSAAPAQYAPEVPRDENSAMQVRLINVLSAIGCQIAGVNPAYPNRQCVGVNKLTEKISFVPKETNEQQIGGAIGFVNTMMVTMYAFPAASTNDYLAYLGDNFGIVKPAHAQGVGFSSLSPILPLWTASRNIAYIFYILAFIVIGMLIMIRVRLDPRTVMTIQNQIPKIVVGIVLITFSYAIAGFLIDLMYTSMYVLSNVITSIQVPIQGEVDGDGKPTFHNYTELGPNIISSTNPITAASKIAGGDSDVPIIGSTLNGISDLANKPANEIGKAFGNVFQGDYGRWVKIMLIGLLTGLSANTLASATGASSGGSAGFATALSIGLGALSLFVPALGVPASLLIPALVATPLAAKSISKNRGGKPYQSALLALGGGLAFMASKKAFDSASGDGESIQEAIFSIIAFIIIAVAILSSLIRLWFSLMKAYILILLNIVLAPFYILFGLFPGSGWSFNTWLRTMCAHLAVFPVVVVVFLVARVIIDGLGTTQSQGVFVPPFLGNASIAGTIQSIVGLTFILVMPAIVEMVRGIFQSKPSPYTGPAINPGIAAGVGYTAGLVRNPLAIMSQAEEGRMNTETQKFERTGTMRALVKRTLGG